MDNTDLRIYQGPRKLVQRKRHSAAAVWTADYGFLLSFDEKQAEEKELEYQVHDIFERNKDFIIKGIHAEEAIWHSRRERRFLATKEPSFYWMIGRRIRRIDDENNTIIGTDFDVELACSLTYRGHFHSYSIKAVNGYVVIAGIQAS